MPIPDNTRVMACVDYFPPSQYHELEYWPLAGEEGRVIHREGEGPDGLPLYAVLFDDDVEAVNDKCTWTYAETELEII